MRYEHCNSVAWEERFLDHTGGNTGYAATRATRIGELYIKYVPACVCQHTGRSRFSFSVATEIEGSGSSASGSPQTMPTAQRPSRVPGPRTWLGFALGFGLFGLGSG